MLWLWIIMCTFVLDNDEIKTYCRNEELDRIANLMQLYKFNGSDVMALDNNVYFCTR